MRETRMYGSEGGGAARSPYPYVRLKAPLVREGEVLFRHALCGL